MNRCLTPESSAELLGNGPAPALAGDDLHLWLFALPVQHAALRPAIEKLPTAAEHARAARCVFAADRLRQVHARGLLRLVLGNYLTGDPQGVRIVTNEHGKPSLSPAHGLHFNLSHCQDLVLVGLTRRAAVGVDVERIRTLSKRDRLAAHCCSADEQAWLASRPVDAADHDFFRIWTAKEAALKALGTGLAMPPERISVRFPETDMGHPEVTGVGSPWTLFSACPDRGHTLAAAIQAVISGERIRCFGFPRQATLP